MHRCSWRDEIKKPSSFFGGVIHAMRSKLKENVFYVNVAKKVKMEVEVSGSDKPMKFLPGREVLIDFPVLSVYLSKFSGAHRGGSGGEGDYDQRKGATSTLFLIRLKRHRPRRVGHLVKT
jgi:hypothetical protein